MDMDFRVDASLLENPKVRRLLHRFGETAILFLLKFWGWTRIHRSDGELTGIETCEDLEIVVGLPQGFGKLLEELKFVDHENEIFVVHHWREHQPWASLAEQRSDAARLSAIGRFDKKLFETLQTKGITSISKSDYEAIRNATPSDRSATAKRLLSDRSTNVSKPQSPCSCSCSVSDSDSDSKKTQECSSAAVEALFEKVVEIWKTIGHVALYRYKRPPKTMLADLAALMEEFGEPEIFEALKLVRESEWLPRRDVKLALSKFLKRDELEKILDGQRSKLFSKTEQVNGFGASEIFDAAYYAEQPGDL